MRTITISWTTTSMALPGVFAPIGYRVTVGALSTEVPVSPATFHNFEGPAGTYTASVQLIDTAGAGRGVPVTVDFEVPEDTTVVNVPIAVAAAVVAS